MLWIRANALCVGVITIVRFARPNVPPDVTVRHEEMIMVVPFQCLANEHFVWRKGNMATMPNFLIPFGAVSVISRAVTSAIAKVARIGDEKETERVPYPKVQSHLLYSPSRNSCIPLMYSK